MTRFKKGRMGTNQRVTKCVRRHVLHLVEKKNIDMSGVFLFETLVAAPDTPNHIFFICLEID